MIYRNPSKKLTPKQIAINKISSEVESTINDIQKDDFVFSQSELLNFTSRILNGANVDTDIIIDVLEQFGEAGKYEATAIKVNEGY